MIFFSKGKQGQDIRIKILQININTKPFVYCFVLYLQNKYFIMKKLLFLSLILALNLVIACKSETQTDSTDSEVASAEKNRTHPAQKARQNSKKAKQQVDHLNAGGMEWMTFDDIAETPNREGKKYLVDVYTEWCGWCKVMDKKTFTDPNVQAYLDKNFHIVKFDAERKTSIPFKGKMYDWQQGGRNGINKLAIELLGPRMSYPTMVYLDENLNMIRSIPGYKKPDQLLADLKVISGS